MKQKKKSTFHFHGKYQFTDPETSTKPKQDKYKENLHLGTLQSNYCNSKKKDEVLKKKVLKAVRKKLKMLYNEYKINFC